jgi:hypothetical protein
VDSEGLIADRVGIVTFTGTTIHSFLWRLINMDIYADKKSRIVIEQILQKLPEANLNIKFPEANSCIHDTICTSICGNQVYIIKGYDDRGSVTVEEFKNYEDFFYEILYFVISYIAFEYERKEHFLRDKNTDFRRLYFNKEIELFRRFDNKYSNRKEKEIADILKQYP